MNFLKIIGCSILSWMGIESWSKAVEIFAVHHPTVSAWAFVIWGSFALLGVGVVVGLICHIIMKVSVYENN